MLTLGRSQVRPETSGNGVVLRQNSRCPHAAPKSAQPNYLHHKPTGQAYVRLPDGNGGRRAVYLGAFGSPESKLEHARILAQLAVAPVPTPPSRCGPSRTSDITLNEVYLAFRGYAEKHYRRADGTVTNEPAQYRQTFDLVLRLYGHTPAAEFGPLALKAVRQKMVGAGWSRKLVNQRVGRVKRVFKWAASEQLVPVSVFQALTTVTGLQAGRTAAEDREPVKPVGDEVVTATLAQLNPHVRGLVEFQRLTGCRPGEACAVRRCDLDTTGAVWTYRPVQFKTRHRGKARVVAVGPKAQALLAGFFTTDPSEYLFSPAKATAGFHAARSANRKVPKYPSHLKRNAQKRKASPVRKPAAKYTVTAYERAVRRACDRAFALPTALARRAKESKAKWWSRLGAAERERVEAWRVAHRWAPNQLRHAHGTEVRKRFGLEAAQVSLGHANATVTEVYAERNEGLAAVVAAEIG